MEKKFLLLTFLCILLGGFQTRMVAQTNIPIPIFKDPPIAYPQDLGSGETLRLSAWYNEDSLKIEVNNYLGDVEVHIYNEYDAEVFSFSNSIFLYGRLSVGIQNLATGFYRLEIILDDENYIGEFDVF